jgi:hypothetical protein
MSIVKRYADLVPPVNTVGDDGVKETTKFRLG